MDLGLTESRFWALTPRELAALYHALAKKEARWRFYFASVMGAKHKNGRTLTLDDFLPEQSRRASSDWQSMLSNVRAYIDKSNRLIAVAGKVVSDEDIKDLIN